MGDLRLLVRLFATNLQSELSYPGSFLMLTLGRVFLTGSEFVAMALLFERFSHIQGWRLPEVALLYGMASLSFAAAGVIFDGFGAFGENLKEGGFDRVLLRPRPAPLLVAGTRIAPRRLGRFLQGGAVLAWALPHLSIAWTPAKVSLLVGALLGGVALFGALFVVQATVSFWTIESLEVMNVLTFGGVTAAQYPVSIYRGHFRDLLVYVLPLACLNYLPALVLLGRPDELGLPAWAPWVSPLVGPVALLLALAGFRLGTRWYQSSGS